MQKKHTLALLERPRAPRLSKAVLLVCLALHNNSCNSSGLTYAYALDQPLNFVMTESLQKALDDEGRALYQRAALHAAEALGTEAAFAPAADAALLASQNQPVQLTLGAVDGDCTGDRAGYVRWRPNNVLQVCPSMVRERSPLMVHSLLMHELGHVIGGNHVGCDGESLMAPDLNCPTNRYRRAAQNPQKDLWYSTADLREICQHTGGGVCRAP